MIDKFAEISLLYDFYGQLLTKKKQQVIELYHDENMSLAEIADEFGISRAAVHDSLKSAEQALIGYEEKLGLAARFMETREAIAAIDEKIDSLTARYGGDEKLVESLAEIKAVINGLDEEEEGGAEAYDAEASE